MKYKHLLNSVISLSAGDIKLSEVKIESAEDADESTERQFEMIAYSGDVVGQGKTKIIVDLEGIQHKDKFPILLNHSASSIVGNALEVTRDMDLRVRGVVYTDEDAGAHVLRMSAKPHFQWEASMGFLVNKIGVVADGEEREVNGRIIQGPVAVVEESTLRECSFVPLGEDSQTEALAFSALSNERSPVMDDEEKKPGATVAELKEAFPEDPEFIISALERGLSLEEAMAEHESMMAKKAMAEKEAMEKEMECLKREMAAKVSDLESKLQAVKSRGADPVDVQWGQQRQTIDMSKPLDAIKGSDDKQFIVEWNQSEELRRAFSDFDSYKTLRLAEEAGLVRYK